ncbi:putative pentatricopeptide repeat-containing protein At3g05240 [Prosopis cineraria]|uniref:putative pentatricopeptide repeat-containing protein At3g05240 n=1 Tax=Prosopis cineraria TaxID=364024 RepID=UPI00240EC3C8|nr:putative pentatricopeptide repeat-containing protein At3g05240 [Prosopis cineraria]XP_054810062.1 putative pentatricopeptide repeat-containing protein At3g05240 [Prosopis cineraria]XP_054810063.1 putative pentatricopeptide repeat-containing protein At3g05240 [Prosopis cineraria]XP_054810064.1 putative pentatricopeptide repeat-containing protein At3g05240 [Prosopis cineraria]
MQKAKVLCFARVITSKFANYRPTASNNCLLSGDNTSSGYIYMKNREIDHLIVSKNLYKAIAVFNNMPVRDVVTYNLLISGQSRYRLSSQALHLYAEMGLVGMRESASTFSSVIGVCSDAGFYIEGVQVHCRVIKLGFDLNVFVIGAIIDFYMRMGLSRVAMKVFDELPHRDLAVWNIVLRGLSELGRMEEEVVLGFQIQMESEGVEPNGLTFCYLLRGCSNLRLLYEGKKIQSRILKLGLGESNIYVANALVDFYSACGCLVDARKSFEAIPIEDVISWNSLVSVYVDNNLLCDALELFTTMQLWGQRPSIRSLVGFLNFSSRIKNINLGKQIHCYVLKLGFDTQSVHVQSSLIDMYGKCSDIDSSIAIFECLPEKTLQCCNSLMTSLSQCNATEDAVQLFGLMLDEGIKPDEITFSTTLKALSSSASPNFSSCQVLHCFALKCGFEEDIAVACSVIDAYSRFGHVELSCRMFETLRSPNAICFTSMINGFARNGMGREGLELLQAMVEKGLKPDKVTFLCALVGCSHSGLVDEGRLVFNFMKSLHGVSPDRQHFSCMVDLLCRAGLLYEAEELLQKAHGEGDCSMWCSLLTSCRVHKNEEVGRRVAKIIAELGPNDPAVWLQASQFYSEIGDFDASMQIREVALARKMIWEIGRSLIEIKH